MLDRGGDRQREDALADALEAGEALVGELEARVQALIEAYAAPDRGAQGGVLIAPLY